MTRRGARSTFAGRKELVPRQIHAHQLLVIPHIAALVGERRMAPDRQAAERVVRGFPLLALLLPTITGRVETRAVETTAARGLLGLAPSTVLQMRGHGQPVLGAMSQLVERMPIFRLELGTNLSRIPEVVDGLINELRDR